MSINRYVATKTKNDGTFETTKYPNFPKSSTDLYIISRDQDRLDMLANEFYEDPRYWWVIAQANPGLGKGSFDVAPGIQLRIPHPLMDVTEKLHKVQVDK